jgi:hypothetical protein
MKAVVKMVTFTVKVPVDPDNENNKETKEVELDAHSPNLREMNLAQMAYNRGLDVALRSKAPFRIEVENLLKERKVWTEVNEKKFKELQTEISKKAYKLKAGGMKFSEARDLALEIRKDRSKLVNLTAPRRQLDLSTAEAQAEVARFNWFVANCVVYNKTGKYFFEGETDEERVEDYLEKGNTEYAQECAKRFSMLQYGVDPDAEKKLEENQFLLKYKFVRPSDLKLIDRQGNLIDEDGQFVDEEGYVLDKPGGSRVNHSGAPINKEGEIQIETAPFTDDAGNPVLVES